MTAPRLFARRRDDSPAGAAARVPWRERAGSLAPGVLMALVVAAAAQFLAEHYSAPVMLFALLIGMAFHFLSVEGKCADGVDFTASRLLKVGVALLGARVTLDQIASLGAKPLLMTPVLIFLTIGSGVALARLLNKSSAFGVLSGGAVAICGASAALAIASVMPKSDALRRDAIFTVVAVTTLSTIAMIAYPIVFDAIGLTDTDTGLLIGATIHDVAQVVGAGYAVSLEAGDVATYAKLLRVACLPVVVIVLSLTFREARAPGERRVFPWFAVGFAVILGLNSAGLIPPAFRAGMEWASRWLLIAAIAALGMKTSLKAMADLGPRHIAVVVGETAILAIMAVIAVKFL